MSSLGDGSCLVSQMMRGHLNRLINCRVIISIHLMNKEYLKMFFKNMSIQINHKSQIDTSQWTIESKPQIITIPFTCHFKDFPPSSSMTFVVFICDFISVVLVLCVTGKESKGNCT